MSRFARRSLVVGVAFVLLCLGVWFYAQRRADEVIDRHGREAADALTRLVQHVARRPALAPWPADQAAARRPTDARPIYERALAYVDAIPEAEQEILPENRYENLEEIDEQAVRAFVVKHQALYDDLAAVLHTDRVSADPRLAQGLEGVAGEVARWQALHNMLQGATRNAMALGLWDVASRLVLLHLCAAEDLGRGGTLIELLVGMGIASAAIDHARLVLAQGALDDDALAGWARALDALDGHRRPLKDVWSVEEPWVRHAIAHDVMQGDATAFDDVDADVGWRYLWSRKLWAAEALELLPDAYRRLAAVPEQPDSAAIAAAQRIVDDEGEAGNALVRSAIVMAPMIYRLRAQHRMRWHLLRVGVALARHRAEHGAWPKTLAHLVPTYLPGVAPCPLAEAPLGHAGGRVWSWGGDGDDDGGRAIDHDDVWEADGDVVFDLEDATLPDPFAWAK